MTLRVENRRHVGARLDFDSVCKTTYISERGVSKTAHSLNIIKYYIIFDIILGTVSLYELVLWKQKGGVSTAVPYVDDFK